MTFADNLTRLCGMHMMTAARAAQELDVSPQTMSEWKHGREPSVSNLINAASFFELPIERLLLAEFIDLLRNELVDEHRWQRIEDKLKLGFYTSASKPPCKGYGQ